jgi:uncharacterized integral membrane protein
LQRLLRWVIGLPLTVLVIAFAIANRQRVTLSFDPLSPSDPFASIDMPLWLLFFFGIFFGIFAGWLACWVAQGKHRKRAREASADVARLQAEKADLLKRLPEQQTEEPAPQHIVPMGSGWI